MGIEQTLAKLRKKAQEAREGMSITFGGTDYTVFAPNLEQMDRWGSGSTSAAEILRTCLADPESGRLIFAKANDEAINKCSVALVKRCTNAVKQMMEDSTGNFESTAADKPSTE